MRWFDLSKRWMGVRDTRATETDDSVNSRFVDDACFSLRFFLSTAGGRVQLFAGVK